MNPDCLALPCCPDEHVCEASMFKNLDVLLVPSESVLLAKHFITYKNCTQVFVSLNKETHKGHKETPNSAKQSVVG